MQCSRIENSELRVWQSARGRALTQHSHSRKPLHKSQVSGLKVPKITRVLGSKTTLGPGVSPRFYFWEYVGKPKNTVIYSSFRGSPRLSRAISWVALKETRPSQGRLRKNCGRVLLNFALYRASRASHLETRTGILWFGHGCFGQRMISEHERDSGLGMDALVIALIQR